jgi:putative oligomerization/nucleic acid binding protein
MPLLRGVARTAVIAGTATAVSNRVSRRQANRWAQEEEAQYGSYQEPAPAAAAAAADPLEQLKQLGELKASGVLTEAEFEAQKAKILAGAA